MGNQRTGRFHATYSEDRSASPGIDRNTGSKSVFREGKVAYRFEDLVDIPVLQDLTDEFFRATSIPSAIITIEGDVLTGSGWQRICIDFHRTNTETLKDCIESDIKIRKQIAEGTPFAIYTCPRGLVDASSPVVIEGRHMANVFAGQLLMEPITDHVRSFFREQARRFGFEEEAYMAAVENIPVLQEEKFRPVLSFLSKFALLVASIGLARLREIEALENLRLNEEKYRRLLESTKAVPWELDVKTGQFTYIGPQAEKVFGYPLDSWRDLDSWAERLHPEDREESVRICQRALEEGRDHDLSYRVVGPDGRVICVHDVTSVIEGPEGPEKLIGFMHDISVQKETEEERRGLEEELRHLQKLEAVGTLAGGIAHDFNNLLSAIIGYTELSLLSLDPSSTVHKNLNEVLTASERSKDLVRQILSFSRKNTDEQRPVDISENIKETVRLLRSTIPSTIVIDGQIEATGAKIFADPTQIHQVIMNLGTNAYHSMRTRGGTLAILLDVADIKEKSIETAGSLSPGTYIRLSVSDTGDGIDRQTMEKIFDPYFTTKGIGEGTGLGLSVVRGIVIGHGGALSVDSSPGEGTTFIVYFPLYQDQNEKGQEICSSVKGGCERILFVDDEPVLSRLGSKILESLGYSVSSSTSSREALEIFSKNPHDYDLVISDQTMPGMTGADLAKEIFKYRPNIKIILCTGHSDLIDKASAEALGISYFIYKPLNRIELGKVVRSVLDG